MSKKLHASITLASLPLTVGVLQAVTSRAHAEEIAVGIFPTITEITAQAGETLETKIEVKNSSDASVTLTTLLQPFTASGQEDGQVRYLNEAPDIFRRIQVFDDQELADEITLNPNEEKTLTMRIRIPEDETSRDYYYSLVLLSKPNPEESDIPQEGVRANATISGGVAGHFLVSVNPETQATVKAVEFTAPALSPTSPVPFTIRIANLGPNFTAVRGELEVQNIFGIREETVSIPETTILSQSTRRLVSPGSKPTRQSTENQSASTELNASSQYQFTQSKHLIPGVYKAHLHLQNTTDNASISKTIYFAVAPIQLIIGLIVLVVLIYLIRRRIRQKFS